MPIDIKKFEESPTKVEEEEHTEDTPELKEKKEKIKRSLEGECFFNDGGTCTFLIADPVPCDGMCPQWKSCNKRIKRAFKKSHKTFVEWYDIVTLDIKSAHQVQRQLKVS